MNLLVQDFDRTAAFRVKRGELLVNGKKFMAGEVVEGLDAERLRVLWKLGTIEIVPRDEAPSPPPSPGKSGRRG